MHIDRIRTLLFEASVIFLAGVLIAVPVLCVIRYMERPTIADFKREYFTGDVLERRDVAFKYLASFPAQELIQAVEDESAALGCHLQGHGIGHAFAYMADGDLDRAVAGCSVLKEKHAINPCVSGAFMETFLSTTSKEQMQEMNVSPCDRYPGTEVLCYRYRVYGWITGHGAQNALNACKELGKNEGICIRSIAMAAATTEMMQRPNGLNELCGTLTGGNRTECFAGAFLRLIDSNNGDDSERLCDVVDATYREGCLKTLNLFLDSIAA